MLSLECQLPKTDHRVPTGARWRLRLAGALPSIGLKCAYAASPKPGPDLTASMHAVQAKVTAAAYYRSYISDNIINSIIYKRKNVPAWLPGSATHICPIWARSAESWVFWRVDPANVADDCIANIGNERNRELPGLAQRVNNEMLSVARVWRVPTAHPGSAWHSFDENDLGTIEPGKLADLAVLSDDPLTVSDDDLRRITSKLTLRVGKIVHGTEHS